MDLLERYLQATRFFLPRRQQDDILRELSENLISQMEEREEALGRALDEAEQADILRRHRHPMVVAGRYRSHQLLIGPVFFPVYLVALQVGLGAALLVTLVLAGVAALLYGDPIRSAVEAMLAFPGRGLMVFAWTTLVFAGLDMARVRLGIARDWDPRKLPAVVRPEFHIRRLRTLWELVVLVSAILWLVLLPWAPHLLLGPAAAVLEPAPIWPIVYFPILALWLAAAGLHAVDVVRPYWTRTRGLLRLAVHGSGLVVLAVLLTAGAWFRPTGAATLPGGVRGTDVVDLVNASFYVTFIVIAVISLIGLARELHRLKNRRIAPLPSETSSARAAR